MSENSERKGSKPAVQDAETVTGETLPLLVNIEAETWLANRLLDHGIDIYLDGAFPTYLDRLGAAIVANGIQRVIVGRKDGKPEMYSTCFERIAGKPLPKAVTAKVAKEGA